MFKFFDQNESFCKNLCELLNLIKLFYVNWDLIIL